MGADAFEMAEGDVAASESRAKPELARSCDPTGVKERWACTPGFFRNLGDLDRPRCMKCVRWPGLKETKERASGDEESEHLNSSQ